MFDSIEKDLDKTITNMFKNAKKGNEIEFKFFSRKRKFTFSSYNKLVNYMKFLKAEKQISLDILCSENKNFNKKEKSVYRLSIYDYDNINSIINSFVSSIDSEHIFTTIVENINNYKNVVYIVKNKFYDSYFYINNYDILLKLDEEKPIKELPKNNDNFVYTFRFKERLHKSIIDNDEISVSIDLTSVNTVDDIKKLNKNENKYELELDITIKKPTDGKKYYEKIYNTIINLIKFYQQTEYLITEDEIVKIDENIKKTLYANTKELVAVDLPVMNSYNLDKFDFLNTIKLNYTVTDKADGDRCFLYLFDNNAYIINMNMEIKKIKENINSEFNNTIIDGEYLFINGKYVFLAFDILFINEKDVREIDNLKHRFMELSNVLHKVFNVQFKFDNNKNFGLDETSVTKYYKDVIKNYFDDLKNMMNNKSLNVVYYKFFIFPIGISNSEIYLYSYVMCKLYNELSPYALDGLIFTPIKQKYTKYMKNMEYKIYKWKPKDKNSIDFYVEFEKQFVDNTENIVNVFDNSNIDQDILQNSIIKTNNIYRIIKLYVGKKTQSKSEYPVLFSDRNNTKPYIVNLRLINGEPRDIEGNVIMDKTVVEFVYNYNNDADANEKWIPLRTRFDKTESVQLYKLKYGNNEIVANNIWKTMIDPITIDDFYILSDKNNFNKNYEKYSKKQSIDNKNIYYQLHTDIAQNMRSFNNWIKSNLINSYCYSKNVLDFGIGRGGDILKYLHSKVNNVVGIDIDASGLFGTSDSAVFKYNELKLYNKHVPDMKFIHANAGSVIDKKLILNEKVSSFDVITCQFMIHYLFESEMTFNNFCINVNNFLNKNGYLIITTMDGLKIHNMFKETNPITFSSNENNKLFEITKVYDNDDINSFGNAINVYISSFMSQGEYAKEYLVSSDFLIKKLDEKCNLKLVEMDSFENLYNNYKPFFVNYSQCEKSKNYQKMLSNIASFYVDNPDNRASYGFTKLNNYYVFIKK